MLSLIALLTLLASLAVQAPLAVRAAPMECARLAPSRTVEIPSRDGARVFEFDLPWKIQGSGPAEFADLEAIRIPVRRLGLTDPRALLERQKRFFVRQAPEEVPFFDAILAGRWGRIEAAACAEQFLLDTHFRLQQRNGETEMGAVLLEKGTQQKWVLSSGDHVVAIDATLRKRVQNWLRRGWRLRVHLHNHPFFLNAPGDIAGTLIPSPSDRRLYANPSHFGAAIPEAWITNGFDTIRIPTLRDSALRDSD